MPYVTDSQSMGYSTFTGSYGTKTVESGTELWQRGYRSGPRTASERRLLAVDPAYKRSQTVKALGLLEELNYEGPGGRTIMSVHDRWMSRRSIYPIEHRATWMYSGRPRSMTGLLWFEGQLCRPWIEPYTAQGLSAGSSSSRSSNAFEAEASAIMRSQVPTAPEIDMFAFIGEQKDAPAIFRAANYIPRSKKDLGGAYLNYVFGVAPTVSDLQRISETVVSSGKILAGYVEHEQQILRRRSEKPLVTETYSGTSSWSSSRQGSGSISNGLADAPGTFRYQSCHPFSSDGPGILSRYTVTSTYTASLNVFSSWIYYIPRPSGFAGRLETYRKQATRLLGGGLTPSAAWELTKMSWLIDWFVDVGGLLRYQQAVAESNVTALRSGYTIRQSATSSFNWELRSATSQVTDLVTEGTTCWARQSYETRHPGGPYSIVQPWNLSGSQAAVVTALGLSRS